MDPTPLDRIRRAYDEARQSDDPAALLELADDLRGMAHALTEKATRLSPATDSPDAAAGGA